MLQAVTGDVTSIPTSMHGVWLALVTLTSVGYGIIYPVTSSGRLMMTLTMIFGVIFLTMPLTIVSESFVSITKAHKHADRVIQQLMIHQVSVASKSSRSELESRRWP